MNYNESISALDNLIEMSRVALYKPIQIAEILYRDRVAGDIDLANLETYRRNSKKWRDVICQQFVGRSSTSSSKYQDDIFSKTAMPPEALVQLGIKNRATNGQIEAYIYHRFSERYNQMFNALNYTNTKAKTEFDLAEFLSLFWMEKGLKRSIDKIYEIVVYALFSAIVDVLEVTIQVSISEDKKDVLVEFEDFARSVIQLSGNQLSITLKAQINRVGVTNAADRGLDMWANFGMAIQIKHLSLTEDLAENIVTSVSSDRIVIVCKDSDEKIIVSLLNQIGWKSKIQSIITESHLLDWYNKALKGKYSNLLGDKVIKNLNDEIALEFPIANKKEFNEFISQRGYVLK